MTKEGNGSAENSKTIYPVNNGVDPYPSLPSENGGVIQQDTPIYVSEREYIEREIVEIQNKDLLRTRSRHGSRKMTGQSLLELQQEHQDRQNKGIKNDPPIQSTEESDSEEGLDLEDLEVSSPLGLPLTKNNSSGGSQRRMKRKIWLKFTRCMNLRVQMSIIMVSQIIISVGIIWFLLWNNSSITLNEITKSLRNELSNKLESTVISYLRNASLEVAITNEKLRLGILNISDVENLEKHFFSMITQFESLSFTYIGIEENGNFHGYGRRSDGHIRLLRSNGNLTREEFEIDEQGNPTSFIRSGFYDSRLRPWYIAAINKADTVWSDAYVFASAPVLGVTVSTPFYQNGTLLAVSAADLFLEFIDNFLANQKLGKTGIAYVVDRNGKLVATSRGSSVKEGPNGVQERIIANESPDAIIRRSAQKLIEKYGGFDFNLNQGQVYSFSFDGGEQFGTLSLLDDGIGVGWWLIIAIPRTDWFERIDRTNIITLVFCCLVLLIAIAIAFWSAIVISRPLHRIQKGMELITKKLDFTTSEGNEKLSIIKEIALIQSSFSNLKVALRSFSLYIPVEVVRLLMQKKRATMCMNRKGEAVLGVDNAYCTIFFSDLADFTSISEIMRREHLMIQLTDYLEHMSSIITKSKGTLADYIGDSVFAFWNAPEEVEYHYKVACEAALQMQEKMKLLSKKWEEKNFPPLKTRIGLHIGHVWCGNVGSSVRMKYTLIGDPVNLASRLENLNKMYGTWIILSEDLQKLVCDDYLCRPLDVVAVKGRKAATKIFELVCRRKEATPQQLEICEAFEKALKFYLNQDFQECIDTLKPIQDIIPNDIALKNLCSRSEKYKQEPPSKNWNGVEILHEK